MDSRRLFKLVGFRLWDGGREAWMERPAGMPEKFNAPDGLIQQTLIVIADDSHARLHRMASNVAHAAEELKRNG